MNTTKGLAIRLDNKIIKKIDKQNVPRNDLIQKAVINYLNNSNENNNDFEEIIPDDVYDEIYNTLYNTEMTPLNQKIKHKEEIIKLLNEQIDDIKKDKKFLQDQIFNFQKKEAENLNIIQRIKRRLSKKSNEE